MTVRDHSISQNNSPSWRSDLFLRLLDLLIAALIIAVAFIPAFIIAISILLDDGKPILFRQKRVGRSCKPFSILKFRTMTHDTGRASGEVGDSGDLADARAGFQTASYADPRVTRTGRILRATHLDELPQVLNVFRGEMSVVGVRPDVPAQEADYSAEDWIMRHKYRPGITGLAQIDADANEYFFTRIMRDKDWISGRSVSVYCWVLWKTVLKVLKRTGL